MQTLTSQTKQTTGLHAPIPPAIAALKAKQKATWESGDYGQIGHSIEHVAEEFMARLTLLPGARVLDLACGTGNLAVIAARKGCQVSGVDIATNLLDQARARSAEAGLSIEFVEADAEALPLSDDSFDLAVSMFGVMFTPQPAAATAELNRVLKPGGQLAFANWTPEGFIGKMFKTFKQHLPPPPAGVPSPLDWGNEAVVRQRLDQDFTELRLTKRFAVMRFPFPPAETVEFFRKYYGPTLRAFESLPAAGQATLRRDLVELQTRYNQATTPAQTEVAAEYLEIIATKI
ncbi:MAG TPA: methyltransferase domain-containing protein [Verrucomicrobiae bacterium]|nr:methyltransferase domain-containing protein [Verrucomicrobiae bacterium]